MKCEFQIEQRPLEGQLYHCTFAKITDKFTVNLNTSFPNDKDTFAKITDITTNFCIISG